MFFYAHVLIASSLQDGPLGVRNTDHNTAFPAGITVGATFDKDLMYRRAVAIGEEFRGKGVNIHLGPSVGALGRKPRGGRSKLELIFE
jgi:beta-glucosidase